MMSPRQLLDQITLTCLKLQLLDRLVGYLAWQRRRGVRRRLEATLEQAGHYPDEVVRGPFSGMRLPPRTMFLDARFEKVFGAYEHELFPWLEELASSPNQFSKVVNVGAADGFFAVGLARLLPQVEVVAFEPNGVKTPVLREMARINGVDGRITLHGFCREPDLQALSCDEPVLVVMDIDGGERDLLDPQAVPWLVRAAILVETHDAFVPGVTALLMKRFAASHSIVEFSMRGPDFGSIAPLRGLRMHEVDALVGSERPGLQSWLWMRPLV